MKRPCSASFGFGGKLISFTSAGSLDALRRSTVRISPFIIDARVSRATEAFENAVKNNDLRSICKARISDATFSADKADWKLIETLALENPRKRFVEHLGVSSTVEADADVLPKLPINEENKEILEMPERSHELSLTKPNRLPAFFDSNFKGDDFLSDLAATKGAKTNNPFQIYSSNESEPDRGITHALLLGQFEKALDLCLQEDRLPDAFMIAICGGQDCIDKVQKAYFNKKRAGPNYMRLLASVVGKNLWDVVYNAEIRDWKEVMAILCTYASANEFPDLCEALGDRLEENMTTNDSQSLREEASLCYLAGSKLEKVVPIWISELDENRASNQEDIESSNFSTYVCLLQNFIEKVTVFREVTHFHDNDLFAVSGWKLSALYDKYAEYADIVTSHGQLQIAYKYLTLLPEKYPSAAVSKNRIKEAIHQPALGSTTNKSANSASRTQRSLPNVGNHPSPVKPSALEVPKSYIISSQAPPPNTRSQAANGPYNATVFHSGHVTYDQAYQPQRQPQLPPNMTQPAAYNSNYPNQNAALPQRNFNASPSIPPPSQAQNISNWNDTPESFFKPPTSRRGTPSTGITNAAVPLVYPAAITPNVGTPYGIQPKPAPPLAPPPKGSAIPPPRMSSPSSTISHSYQSSERPSSSAASAYLPQQPNPTSGPVHSVALQQQQGLAHPRVPTQHQGLIPRGPSPYHAPPSTPPVSNRYAPTISTTKVGFGSQSEPSDITGPNQHAPPSQHPYSPQKSYIPHQLNASIQPSGPQMSSSLPPKSFEASTSASRGFAQNSRSVTDQVQPGEIAINPVHVKHRKPGYFKSQHPSQWADI